MLFVWRNSFLTVLVGFCFLVACMGGMGKWSHTPNLAVGTSMKNFRKCLQCFFATLTGHHVQLELAAELGYITMSKFLYAHRLMFRKCISSGVCILVAYDYFLRVLCVALHGDDSFTAPLNRFQFAKMWCERMFNTKKYTDFLSAAISRGVFEGWFQPWPSTPGTGDTARKAGRLSVWRGPAT